MFKTLERSWRIFATALAFSAFGLGGLALGLVFFPLLHLCVRQSAHKTRLARLTIHYAFKFFIELMRILGILRYSIRGIEKLQRPGRFILANHPTLIDVVFLISLVKNADCVVKAGLAQNPFTRGPIKGTAYICNNSGSQLIDDCIASVHAGNDLIIFPEGTRTATDGSMKLQRGAANIALRGQCDITPVTIRCQPLSLTKGLPWWKVPASRMIFTLDIGDDIAVAPFLEQAGGETALAARQLTQYLHDYFLPENTAHAGA
ncbi:lysophospholipid acyltransferase family protein [Iodobacter fluviatilis]|uniref:1-acyl-sn-glycerol-3-phosphate acyltransferase n=1 Tax=Iodobacter fluviatilis TaxID=537 RepID=A0A377Q7U4_9NEIS|nr:lysophospholipid acyltransferase family protein [Iodobacter fluviatilis]TCU88605.1 1-acyl-sn-glycerol-3-phosphate acyltransferase [Iodobacter fluviatilis]STQ91324.1 acylglycerophosphoethanolamine acyltransferase [Iodobacter fluviatilis]